MTIEIPHYFCWRHFMGQFASVTKVGGGLHANAAGADGLADVMMVIGYRARI